MRITTINLLNKTNFTAKSYNDKFETHKINTTKPSWVQTYAQDKVELGSKHRTKHLSKAEMMLLKTQKMALEAKAKKILSKADFLVKDEDDINLRMLEINQEAKEIQKNAQLKYDEAVECLFSGEKGNYLTQYNESDEGDWIKREFGIMNGVITFKEYDDYDEVIKEAVFGEDKIRISQYDETQKGWNIFEYNAQTSALEKYIACLRESINEGYSAKEQYVFDSNENVVAYDSTLKQHANGDFKSVEHFEIEDGYVKTAKFGFSKSKTSQSAQEKFELKKGSMYTYFENIKEDESNTVEATSMYKFSSQGDLIACACDFYQQPNGEATAETLFTTSNNDVQYAYSNYEFNPNKKMAHASKVFNFNYGKINKCAFECNGSAKTISKIVKPEFDSIAQI